MDKTYQHDKHEKEVYSLWEKSGAFSAQVTNHKSPFTIIMPPPNASDPLHIGHARFVTIQDILIRYHRMRGDTTLWLPGADHAGIETQYLFEKKLKQKTGKNRSDYDRDIFYKMIWNYCMENKTTMESQLRKLGASCDWSRNTFTLDPKIIAIVYKTFKKLYDDGLVYRGERIVNYCTRCGTSFSQLEVNYVEQDDLFYYINYGSLTIATTRPETIFADTAVAVNSKDSRFKNKVGKTATLPLVGRSLPIVADSLVNPTFGTGALKVTPGHDATDYEIGEKHGLPRISVVDTDGKMINTPKKYIGMYASRAREEVVTDLKAARLIKKVEKIHHTIGVCYKHKTPIEPLLSKQWFIKIKPLADKALEAIKTKKVRVVSKSYEKIAKHWLKNLRDWNISRQIVWGIRIPAWRCNKCTRWTITDGASPKQCSSCNHKILEQDKDTFDTWFSSGQWPFATLLTTNKLSAKSLSASVAQNSKLPIGVKTTPDFDYFYPTSVMETAYDILPFWVIRMIMLGLYATGDVPFRDVLFHGLVRDKNGEKISKSKGNVIDPLVMAEKYGADALRMGLIWGALVENDIALSEDNIRGQRNFCNKVWNVARFVLSYKIPNTKYQVLKKPRAKNEDDKWILAELKKTTKKVSRNIETYRLSEAAAEIYDFVWHKFADVYIEKAKEQIRNNESGIKNKDSETVIRILHYVLDTSLRLLHPFMPFLTEAIWSQNFAKDKSNLLITTSWPS